MRHEAGSAQRQALMIGLLLLTSASDLEIGVRYCFGVPSSASLVSMVDRTSRIARFINTRKSDIVSAVIIEHYELLNRPVHSLTSDNGKEFSQYQTMAKELGTDFILPTLTLLGSVEPMKIPMDC